MAASVNVRFDARVDFPFDDNDVGRFEIFGVLLEFLEI